MKRFYFLNFSGFYHSDYCYTILYATLLPTFFLPFVYFVLIAKSAVVSKEPMKRNNAAGEASCIQEAQCVAERQPRRLLPSAFGFTNCQNKEAILVLL